MVGRVGSEVGSEGTSEGLSESATDKRVMSFMMDERRPSDEITMAKRSRSDEAQGFTRLSTWLAWHDELLGFLFSESVWRFTHMLHMHAAGSGWIGKE